MKTRERDEMIRVLATVYLREKDNNRVWQREDSRSSGLSFGMLQGACMAFNLDVEETDSELVVITRIRRKIIVKIDKNSDA